MQGDVSFTGWILFIQRYKNQLDLYFIFGGEDAERIHFDSLSQHIIVFLLYPDIFD